MVIGLICACSSDDETWSDNYQMTFLDLATNADGKAAKAVSDEGETWIVDNPIGGLKNDTIYRIIAMYTRNDQHISLSSYAHAISARPVRLAEDDSLYTDPVGIQRIWKVPNYINATLSVANKDKNHVLGFVEQSITTNSDGKKIAHIQFYHNRNNDIDAFNSTAYISLPLRVYAETLTTGQDSIYFTINTPNGNITYPYLY